MARCSAAQDTSKYLDSLQPVAKERYIRKLECLYGGPGVPADKLLCPYDDITDDQWLMMLASGFQWNLAICTSTL